MYNEQICFVWAQFQIGPHGVLCCVELSKTKRTKFRAKYVKQGSQKKHKRINMLRLVGLRPQAETASKFN